MVTFPSHQHPPSPSIMDTDVDDDESTKDENEPIIASRPLQPSKPPPPDPEEERIKNIRFVRANTYDMYMTRLGGRKVIQSEVKVRMNSKMRNQINERLCVN